MERGMLTPDQLRQMVANEEIETIVVGFTDHMGRIMGKRFDAEYFLAEAMGQGTHG